MVIVENNTKNKTNLIKTKYKKSNFFGKVFFPLDLITLLFYKNLITNHVKKNMNLKKFIDFSSEKTYKTDNVNNQKIYEKINDFKPDVIITRGTSIIKEPLINYPINYFLNIHGGLVPNYRNVHSVFWSYYFKDFENMGSSILHLSSGVDSGDIALSSNLKNPPLTLKDLHLKSISLSVNLLERIILKIINKEKIGYLPQNLSIKAFYGQTPTFFDFIVMYLNISSLKKIKK
jgi:methionyl-tRNA formyltransferase